jgi:NAD(P)H dehydrogenase (quinone)
MNVVAVFDHPYTAAANADVPHERSFSAALLAAAARGLATAGHRLDVIDLAADRFDPVMSRADLVDWRTGRATGDELVANYQQRLAAADHVLFVFPTWWMSMPAATKGFLDRVLTKGFAFEEPRPGGALVRTLTRLRGVTVLTPMTTRFGLYRLWFARPGHRILFRGTFGLIGIKRLRWFSFEGPAQRSAAWRATQLERVERRFSALP